MQPLSNLFLEPQAEKLHQHFFQELFFAHIQLDALWANVRQASHVVWLWVATEATTKVIPVLRLGPRTLKMAMGVVHGLVVGTMQPGCLPVFTIGLSGRINTAFVERINLTFRQAVSFLVRRTEDA